MWVTLKFDYLSSLQIWLLCVIGRLSNWPHWFKVAYPSLLGNRYANSWPFIWVHYTDWSGTACHICRMWGYQCQALLSRGFLSHFVAGRGKEMKYCHGQGVSSVSGILNVGVLVICNSIIRQYNMFTLGNVIKCWERVWGDVLCWAGEPKVDCLWYSKGSESWDANGH